MEITRLSRASVAGLLALLERIENNGEARFFRPHPFTREHLESLCEPGKQDLHYVLTAGASVLGYGLLRGWDEGYETPSLGIAIDPAFRQTGCALAMMEFLHCAARVRGAVRVRLRVQGANRAAIGLYRRMGYCFETPDMQPQDALLVAFKELKP